MGGGESRSASSSSRLCVHIFRALSNRIVGCLRHGTPRSSPIILHKQPTIACRNLCTHGRRGTLLPAVACPVTFYPLGLRLQFERHLPRRKPIRHNGTYFMAWGWAVKDLQYRKDERKREAWEINFKFHPM